MDRHSNRTRAGAAARTLLDADEWTAASRVYQARSDRGDAWKLVPAARLGQRAATAFVATADRQRACATHLSTDNRGWYLNEAGIFGAYAGDLTGAVAHLHAAAGDLDLLARARDDADHALRLATRTRRLPWAELDALDAHAYLDDVPGEDHDWSGRADTLRAVLIPAGLDPDPLATNEKQAGRRRRPRR